MQGLSAALLLSAEQLGPGAAWYRQEGSSECSWLRRPQPPELRTNFSSRWPWARNSEFRPSERQQWPGPASARPEVARCGDGQGDYTPLPARHLSSARESSVPGALGTVNPETVCSLVPPTPDERLPDALRPPDGEAQSGPPPLTPYQLQAEAAKVERMGNLKCTGGWAARYRVGTREAEHLRSEKSLGQASSFLCSCSASLCRFRTPLARTQQGTSPHGPTQKRQNPRRESRQGWRGWSGGGGFTY